AYAVVLTIRDQVRSLLFPYTTLFRSWINGQRRERIASCCCHLCPDWLLRFPGVWIYRAWKICRDIHTLGYGAALCAFPGIGRVCASFLGNCFHALCHVLLHHWRYAQHCAGRFY